MQNPFNIIQFALLFIVFSQLENRWHKKKRVIEVSFDKEFVSHLPWKPFPPNNEPTSNIPVERLCHVTHRRIVKKIHPSDRSPYTFKARPKMGKCAVYREWTLDGSPLGHSYRTQLDGANPTPETIYSFVPMRDFFLPEGSYSWWSIDTPDAREQSMYGSCMFSVGFPVMLRQFRLAHGAEDLIFKKYGTLRYKKEICYIIIICASNDDLQHVSDLPPVTEEGGHVTLDGMLDAEGRLIKDDAKFTYNKWSYSDWHWEHLVFGFYFSPNSLNNSFSIPDKEVKYTPNIPHDYCIRKVKIFHSWKCPDNISDQEFENIKNNYEDDENDDTEDIESEAENDAKADDQGSQS